MNAGISRRALLAGGVTLLWQPAARAACELPRNAPHSLAELERRVGGRLGVAVLDTETGRSLSHRSDQRFPLCSTFKFIAAAAILDRVDRGQDRLDRWVEYGSGDLVDNAPVSREHVSAGGMLLTDVCAAAVEWSDNTAANLLLKILGGPEALTSYARSLGDDVTRIDGVEPALNVVKPGELHDTTSPAAMVGLLRSTLIGRGLSPDSRERLEQWMLNAKAGEKRMRAGVPAAWRVAHKTGTWDDQTNDIGLIRPPGRSPLVFAVYYTGKGAIERRERVLRDVGRIVTVNVCAP